MISARTLSREVYASELSQRAESRSGGRVAGTAAAPGEAASTPPFQASLWDAFRGTPAPTATSSPTVTNPAPAVPAIPLSARGEAASGPAAGTRSTGTASGSTSTRTANAETEAPAPQDPGQNLISRVTLALEQLGLNPAEFKMRAGYLDIQYPTGGGYQYPVMFAEVNGHTEAFYLEGSLRNPGLVAVNLANAIGRPTNILPMV